MVDLQLDPTTHDLVIDNFKLVLHSSVEKSIQQRLKIRLLNQRGGWFLDLNNGIPYYTEILGKTYTKDIADNYIKLTTITTKGIVSLLDYSSNIVNNKLEVVMSAKAESGVVMRDIGVTIDA